MADPAALVVLAVVLYMTWRGRRERDRTRAAFILWGGWLIITAAVFSFAQGIIHPYYTVALAPAIGAVVGMVGGSCGDTVTSGSPGPRSAVAVGLTAGWGYTMLTHYRNPWLRVLVLAVGVIAAVGILVGPYVGKSVRRGVVILGVGRRWPDHWPSPSMSSPHRPPARSRRWGRPRRRAGLVAPSGHAAGSPAHPGFSARAGSTGGGGFPAGGLGSGGAPHFGGSAPGGAGFGRTGGFRPGGGGRGRQRRPVN